MSTTRVSEQRSRRAQRGAAMVEAAVVMPVLITCFGAMWYAGGARYQKQAQQQRARQTVLTYATNACQGGGEGFAGAGNGGLPPIGSHGGADPTGATRGSGGKTASALRGAASGALGDVDTEFGTAAGTAPAVTWSWDRGRGYGANAGATVSITARSFYFCNEKGYGAWDFFGYAVSVVRMFLP